MAEPEKEIKATPERQLRAVMAACFSSSRCRGSRFAHIR